MSKHCKSLKYFPNFCKKKKKCCYWILFIFFRKNSGVYLCSQVWEPHLCRALGTGSPSPWCCHFAAPSAPTLFHLLCLHLAAHRQHLSESSAPSWTGQLWKQGITIVHDFGTMEPSHNDSVHEWLKQLFFPVFLRHVSQTSHSKGAAMCISQ